MSRDKWESYCHFHHQTEPIPENVYIVCFECGHVWTARALRKAYRGWHWQHMNFWSWWRALLRPAREIFFCQDCLHDF